MSTRTATGRDWAAKNLFQQKEAGGDGGGNGAPPRSDPGVWLEGLRLGEAQPLDPYRIYPLCHENPGPAPSLLLTHQAIEARVLEVIEEGEGGTVQALTARNTGGQPVVVLEGDTLVGCKQNRVVARSVILGGGVSVTIPVGCMEQGRWARRTGRFDSGGMRMSPTMRKGTTHEILQAKKHRGARASLDQNRLWGEVSHCLSDANVTSASSDYYAHVEEHGARARQRAGVLRPQPNQVGVLVMANGTFLGLELAGHPEIWGLLAERTLPAFLLDPRWAREAGAAGGERGRDASAWLTWLQKTRLATGPGLGLGQEVDVEESGLAGSGLWLDDSMVHMAVFAS